MIGAGEIKALAHAFKQMSQSNNLPFKLPSFAFFDVVAIVAIKQRQVGGEEFDKLFYDTLEPFLADEYRNNITLNIYFLPMQSWEFNYGELFLQCVLEHCIDLKFIRHYGCDFEGDTVHIQLDPIVEVEHTVGLMYGWFNVPVGHLHDWAADKEFNILVE